jgi:hypothetical protein
MSVGNCENTQILYDDGTGWVAYNQSNLLTASGVNYVTLAFPGGHKWRKFRIETGWNNSGAIFPYIGLTAASVPQTLIDGDTISCAVISDSLFDGNPVSPFSCGFSFASYLGYLLDWNVFDFSQGGTGYCNPGSGGSNTYGYRIPQVLAAKPSIVVFMGSSNDGAYTQSQVQSAVQAALTALREGGFTGAIVVWGIEPASSALSTTETYVSGGVGSWTDPLSNTYFVPFCNAALPCILGSYNNSPTPGGLSLPSINNFSTYINQTDSIHPLELAVVLEASFGAFNMRQNVFPRIP